MAAKELQHVIIDPGHTRGRISLFHHSIKTYWLVKCLLVKAITSIEEARVEPKVISTLVEINRSILEINLCQLHQYACLGRMEKDIKAIQKVDMLGSSVKDLAPVEGDDD